MVKKLEGAEKAWLPAVIRQNSIPLKVPGVRNIVTPSFCGVRDPF
jgi:hypothetical protein